MTAVLWAAVGCTQLVPRADAGRGDAGRDDAGRTDAGMPDAPRLDATTASDTPAPIDAPEDSGIDAPTDTGLDAPSRCDATFGSARGYILCSETPTSCSFVVALDGDDCNIVCNDGGERCTGATNDGPAGLECMGMGSWACGQNGISAICTCSRP